MFIDQEIMRTVLKKTSILPYLTIILLLFSTAASEGTNNDIFVVSIGDVIEFGRYEQDNILENGSEPIEWIVLDLQSEKVLVISKYGLDMKLYNDVPYAIPWGRVTWENSSIRFWLNNKFFKESFSEDERYMIAETNVINGYTKYSHVYGGIDTEDGCVFYSLLRLRADGSSEC